MPILLLCTAKVVEIKPGMQHEAREVFIWNTGYPEVKGRGVYIVNHSGRDLCYWEFNPPIVVDATQKTSDKPQFSEPLAIPADATVRLERLPDLVLTDGDSGSLWRIVSPEKIISTPKVYQQVQTPPFEVVNMVMDQLRQQIDSTILDAAQKAGTQTLQQ